MSKEILNRVAKSPLVVVNLEDFYPEGERKLLDLKEWLHQGLILREKEFREQIKTHQWQQYQNNYVALTCSTDAIIPIWAYMLLSTALTPFAKKIVFGTLEVLETIIFRDVISELDLKPFVNKSIIIKGCSAKPVPLNAYLLISNTLKPVAKSISFGEACSSVPLYKKTTHFK